MNKVLIMCMVSLLSFFSCKKDDDHKINDLQKTWNFYQFIDKTTNESYPLPAENSADITLHGKNCIWLNGPCNSGSGNYIIDDHKIIITTMGLTEKACLNMEFEDKISQNLSGHYTIHGDTLTIDSDFNTDLVFIRSGVNKTYDCRDN